MLDSLFDERNDVSFQEMSVEVCIYQTIIIVLYL